MLKLNDPRATLLIREDGAKIELRDNDACIAFITIRFSKDEFMRALSGVGFTECEVELRGLDRVGKKRESKPLQFKLPKSKPHDKATAARIAKKKCPKGWVPETYFGSQDSFFNKDGEPWARTTAHRWVDFDPEDEDGDE